MTSKATDVTWVLEAEVFPHSHNLMREAVRVAGHEMVLWEDEWWASCNWPKLHGRTVIFQGSLGNAAAIRATLPWKPGSYCNSPAFFCSAWYPRAKEWLIHERWKILPASALIADPDAALVSLGSPDSVFVRPDSPLKPFSGRVLPRVAISLAALDHGFYYDEENLPVVVAPVQSVNREWRYVVAGRRVVAGSEYVAEGRAAKSDDQSDHLRQFASEIAQKLEPPEEVYVMDVCEAGGKPRLLELNPFSGADLYACSSEHVVTSVSEIAQRQHLSGDRAI
jgi:hypothetical protein